MRASAAGLSAFLLALVVASTFAPVANSSATDISDTKSQNLSVTVANPYYINITSSHATASEPISLDYGADGNVIGNVIATSDTVTTETNSPLTHYLYLSTTSSSNSLTSSDEHNSDSISAGGGDDLTSASALSDNTWGFAIPSGTSGLPDNSFDTSYAGENLTNNSTFTKIPVSGSDILIQSGYGGGSRKEMTTTTSTADVYYGTKAAADLSAGTYANVVRYTAYAEEPDFTTTMIDDLEYMQDMTTEICNNSYAGMTARLKDKRGRGNGGTAADASYGIIKAKDGNCWMTDNFDLYNKTVSYAESDFTSGTFTIPDTSSWTESAATQARAHQATNSGYEDVVYYNWPSAVAVANAFNITTQQNTSICPKGWRLPINGDETTDKSWAKLVTIYGATSGADLLAENHEAYALGFRKYYGRLAYDDGGSEGSQGSSASFWSATPQSTVRAYRMYYNDEGISQASGINLMVSISAASPANLLMLATLNKLC